MKLRLAVLAAVLVFHGAASAAEKKPDEARSYYEAGTKYYSLGEFNRAVENYKKAYELRPDAVLLYNIAQAYRLGGDLNQALFFYKSYLRSAANTPKRAEVQGRIKDLEATIATQKATVSPANDPGAPGTLPPATTSPAATVTPAATTTPAAASLPGQGTGAAAGTSQGTMTRIPSAEEVARQDEGAARPDALVKESAARTVEQPRPFYKKWWFWTAVGVVAAGAAVGIVVASGGKNGPPAGDFPSIAVF